MNRRISYPILNDIYDLPDLKEWNKEEIENKIIGLTDSLINDLKDGSLEHSILSPYNYGFISLNQKVQKSISFQFLKNPKETSVSDETTLTLSYQNPFTLESKVTRGILEIDVQTDKLNPWRFFPQRVNSLENARVSRKFGENIINFLMMTFKPAFVEWALKTLKLSWANSGTYKIK